MSYDINGQPIDDDDEGNDMLLKGVAMAITAILLIAALCDIADKLML